MQEHHSPLLSPIMRAVSWFGNGLNSVIVTIVAAGLFFLARYRREAMFTLATLLASVVTYVLKAIVNRPRPTTNLVEFVIDTKLKSFPSGHVAFYVVFFGFLAFLMYRRDQISNILRLSIALFSLLLIFSVPFSRFYLGAHWFTDVLAGFILGLLYLILLAHFYSRAPQPMPDEEGVRPPR